MHKPTLKQINGLVLSVETIYSIHGKHSVVEMQTEHGVKTFEVALSLSETMGMQYFFDSSCWTLWEVER